MRCGIDEAGRGPLAGPVCAAAVILGDDFPIEILNDSKKMTEAQRTKAMVAIYAQAKAWGIGWASHVEIDEINILNASLLAMQRAFQELTLRCSEVVWLQLQEIVVDGLYVPQLETKESVVLRPMVKADSICPEVMAASILAKTARDRMMQRYGWIYPEYGFEQHKGYPTAMHRDRIARFGPSPIQRMSFNSGPLQGTLPFDS
ncbi:MAG: ribonuclease HII [Termitinemataceae bacterium]